MVSKFCAFVQLMTLAGGQVDLLPAVYRNSLTDQNESRHRLLADHRTGRVLTERCKLGDRVALQVGNALNLPYPDQTFDVVWCENAGCLRPNLPISSRQYLHKRIAEEHAQLEQLHKAGSSGKRIGE